MGMRGIFALESGEQSDEISPRNASRKIAMLKPVVPLRFVVSLPVAFLAVGGEEEGAAVGFAYISRKMSIFVYGCF